MRTPIRFALAFVLLVGGAVFADDDGLPAPTRQTAPQVPSRIRTRFDVKRDGFPFVNMGDFGGPNGNCLGMSLVALDNFDRRMARDASGGINNAEPTTMETVSYAQEHATKIVFETAIQGKQIPAELKPFSDPSLINASLLRIAASGRPEIMAMFYAGGGHANVLYGYKNGKLQLYDPNFPGRTIEWEFDPVTGLAPHPMSNSSFFYGLISYAGAAPASNFSPATDVAKAREVCTAGTAECTSRYPVVTAALSRDDDGKVRVTGHVTRGAEKNYAGVTTPTPDHVRVTVDGDDLGEARLDANGNFSIDVPASRIKDTNAIRVVAMAGEQFAGFLDGAFPRPTAAVGITDRVGEPAR